MKLANTELFDGSLWPPGMPRSLELTPLYAARYQGPLAPRRAPLTAHGHWELIWVFDGHGRMRVGHHPAQTWVLIPETVCLVPPDCPHLEESTGDLDILWVGLQGTVVEAAAPVPTRLALAEGRDLLDRLAEYAIHRHLPVGPEMDGLVRLIHGMVTRRLRDEGNSPVLDRIDATVRWLAGEYLRNLSVADMAAHHGSSEGHFSRLFRARTGMTPMSYLNRIRIEQARRWLENSGLEVSRIAELCGFRCPHYFARVFRRVTGVAPSSLRAKTHAQPRIRP